MRFTSLLPIFVLISSIFSPTSIAHEPKEFTILLTEQGNTPGNVSGGILVETDNLFFINVDEREGTSHRIQFDSDGDGNFGGADDFSTSWLHGSCELNETGSKVNESCMVTESVLLGPENGLLPGNVSLRHQIRVDSNISVHEFSVVFGQDVHVETEPEIIQPQVALGPLENDNDLLVVILFCSLMGILAILPSMTTEEGQ